MVHHGQIEPNDAANLLAEIDKKIFEIHNQPIEIGEQDVRDRIVHFTEIAEIFTHDQMHQFEESIRIAEQTYAANDMIVKQGSPHNNCIYFVKSGEVRERLQEYKQDDVGKGHSLKLKSGNFACLQNMMPEEDDVYNGQNGTYLYNYTIGKCTIIPVDASYLKNIL